MKILQATSNQWNDATTKCPFDTGMMVGFIGCSVCCYHDHMDDKTMNVYCKRK